MPPDITDHHVICLSPLAWDGLWTSRHELCRALARRGAPVTFVDPPVNVARMAAKHRRKAPAARSRPVPDGIHVVQPPPYLPFGAAGRFRRLAAEIVDSNAKRYARFVSSLRDDRPVLLLNSFMPVHGYRVAERLQPRLHLYHRADELRDFPSFRPLYLALEQRVAAEADAVVCVTEQVREGIASVRPDATVVPNGVDVERFLHADRDPRLARLTGPIAGLVGVVDDRVDPSLLAAAARHATLVVAGPVRGVTLPDAAIALGPVDRDEVPGLLAGFDVGLVCYRRDFAGDTLKLYEYLAAGLPVVAGAFAGLSAAREHVRIASGGDSFAMAVVEEAAGRTAAADASRRAAAAEHSWDRRLDAILAVLAGVGRR